MYKIFLFSFQLSLVRDCNLLSWRGEQRPQVLQAVFSGEEVSTLKLSILVQKLSLENFKEAF